LTSHSEALAKDGRAGLLLKSFGLFVQGMFAADLAVFLQRQAIRSVGGILPALVDRLFTPFAHQSNDGALIFFTDFLFDCHGISLLAG